MLIAYNLQIFISSVISDLNIIGKYEIIIKLKFEIFGK